MIGATASAGQAVEKLKVLLDEAKGEWINPNLPAAVVAKLIQEPMQFGPVPAPTRRFLAIDTLAPRQLERTYLRGGFLFASGDTGVADQHCAKVSPKVSIKQHLFATHQPA
jgi:hypothetical protein